jgi:hypothetical protein
MPEQPIYPPVPDAALNDEDWEIILLIEKELLG